MSAAESIEICETATIYCFHPRGISCRKITGQERNRGPFCGSGHSMWIPLGHSAKHAAPCYGCDPELAKESLPGKCPDCQEARRRAVPEVKGIR